MVFRLEIFFGFLMAMVSWKIIMYKKNLKETLPRICLPQITIYYIYKYGGTNNNIAPIKIKNSTTITSPTCLQYFNNGLYIWCFHYQNNLLSITQKPPVHHPEYLYFEEKKSISKTSFDFFANPFVSEFAISI